MIYMDNAATSWPKPDAVYQAVEDCLRTAGANPGRGGYSMARKAGRLVADARDELADLFGIVDSAQLIFTLNATTAINKALFGLVKPGWRVITTAIEHNAVARPLRQLEQQGAKLTVVACDKQGRLDMSAMAKAINSGVEMVVASHGSNVTGMIMPIAEIGQLARQAGALFLADVAQTAGVEEIDVKAMNIDLLAFPGHKSLFGLQGTGGLYIRPDLVINPDCFGGTGSMSESDMQPDFLPDKMESGTPNTPGIASLKAGVEFIRTVGRKNICAHERHLATALIEGLEEIKDIKLYGPGKGEQRTAIVCFTIEGMDSGAVSHLLDRDYGIACRAGLHCAPWAHRTLGTLELGAVRLSPGYFNTMAEVKSTVEALENIAVNGGRK